MIVRAISTAGENLPESILDPRWNLTRDTEFHLTLGAEYTVYAVEVVHDVFWYHVITDEQVGEGFPVWCPAPLFEVVDGSLPSHWVVSYIPHRAGRVGTSIITFPEWAHDRSFYEQLVEGEPDAVHVFQRERTRLNGDGY